MKRNKPICFKKTENQKNINIYIYIQLRDIIFIKETPRMNITTRSLIGLKEMFNITLVFMENPLFKL